MNYSEAENYLFTQLPMYQRQGASAYKADLNTSLSLDAYFGHPHKRYKTVHIAGTNGKGSVSHMLASVLQEAGFKVGLFTSPHLKDYRERIRVNGKLASKEFVTDFVNKNQNKFKELKPSFFEITAAMAFQYFADQNVDVAIIETGMGGRLDSSNIINPILSVITNIGLDHTQFLGDTLPLIAAEKAGIIKKNTPVVIGETDTKTRSVFMKFADENNAPLYMANHTYSAEYALLTLDYLQSFNIYKGSRLHFKGLKLDLLGSYQRKNILTALQAIDVLQKILRFENTAIFAGLPKVVKNTGFAGRWQHLGYNPLIVCDTAHNEDGIRAVTEQIESVPHKKLHFVLGTVDDKNLDKILRLLPQDATYYFTNAKIPRAMDAEQLANQASEYGLEGFVFSDVESALASAKDNAAPEDLIFVGGSTFVVAEVV